MDRNIINNYMRMQNELSRTRDASILEMVFVVWAFLSAGSKRHRLPQELSLRTWANQTLHYHVDKVDLGAIFRDIDHYVPELKGTFQKVYSQITDHPVFGDSLIRFAAVFRELTYEEITHKDWKDIFRKAYEVYIKKYRFVFNDPADVCELMSKSFARLNENVDNAAVYIPFLRTGEIAVTLHETTEGKFKIIGKEDNPEAFSVCMLYCCVFEIDTSEFELMSYDQSLSSENPHSLLSVFPVGAYREEEMFTQLLPKSFSGNSVSVIMVSQSLLFSRRYENLRKWMVLDGYLRAIVAMPPSALLYSRARMVILVFDKHRDDKEILIINAENINRENKRQTRLSEEQINDLVEIIRVSEEREAFSKRISVEQLREMNFSININVLVPETKSEDIHPFERLNSIQKKEQEFERLELNIKEEFKKLYKLIK